MVDGSFLPTTLRAPSPTPPHKGEGLNLWIPLASSTKVSNRHDREKMIQALRHPSPSPLWGGVGEGSSPLHSRQAA
ncbi:hypothetical protein H4S14_002772 [Agrobacterium vitis]|nr:hypothetical protein [Agrobacterium vitis]MBE1439012.1 hypothetical protein [Agrobacterium vitis]